MSKFQSLKKGDIFSELQYYRVDSKDDRAGEVILVNEAGEKIAVGKEYVDSCLISASQYEKEEKITATEAAAKLISSPDVAMRLSFNKKVDEKEVLAEIMKEISGATITQIEAAVKKGLKKTIRGEERVITGRHNGHINEFGRLSFVDMEITTGHNIRQVDPREINWMILKGVKYTVK